MDEVLEVVNANAYFANRIDFTAWRERISQLAAGPPVSYYDMLQLTGQILADLGDHHSIRLTPGEYAQLGNKLDDSTLRTTPPSGKVLASGIGYLAIPAVVAESTSHWQFWRVRVVSACGWIFDLRGQQRQQHPTDDGRGRARR